LCRGLSLAWFKKLDDETLVTEHTILTAFLFRILPGIRCCQSTGNGICIINYDTVAIIYTNIFDQAFKKSAIVAANTTIGKLHLNPEDKKYHLGLKVFRLPDGKKHNYGLRADTYEKYWDNLITYLNAKPYVQR